MKVKHLGAVAAAGILAGVGLALTAAPAFATAPGEYCGQADHNKTAVVNGQTLLCSLGAPGTADATVWRWRAQAAATTAPATTAPATVDPTTAPATTAPATVVPTTTSAKPTKEVTQTCSVTSDISKAKVEGGITYVCTNTNGQLGWQKKGADKVTQTCAIDSDLNKVKVEGGLTYVCANTNNKFGWSKQGGTTTQTCSVAADINKSKIDGGLNYTCANTNGQYGWVKTSTNVTQNCNIVADLNKTRIEGGITYTCVNLNEGAGKTPKFGWGKRTGDVTQTCNMSVDLSKTVVYGDVNITCVNTIVENQVVQVWAPPAGKTCPATVIYGVTCVPNPAPAQLYAVCAVTGEIYVIGGKQCVCGTKKNETTPAAAPVWVPTEEAATVPFTLTAGDSLPVTGSNTSLYAGLGIGLVLIGGATLFFIRSRRSTVKFTA